MAGKIKAGKGGKGGASPRVGSPRGGAPRGGVESGASKVVFVADDGLKALVIAALERGCKQIESSLTNRKARPAEGSYPVRLEVHVTGDITVGKAVEGETREVPDVTPRELLGGLLLTLEPRERLTAIQQAMKWVRRARTQEAATTAHDTALSQLDDVVEVRAAEFGLVSEKVVGARAGAVGGKPAVHVRADVGEHTVSLSVE